MSKFIENMFDPNTPKVVYASRIGMVAVLASILIIYGMVLAI